MGDFERKCQGEGGSSTNEFWRQKTRAPGLSRGVVCVILRLAVLIQYRRVTHTQTYTQTHDDGYYPHKASAAPVITPLQKNNHGNQDTSIKLCQWMVTDNKPGKSMEPVCHSRKVFVHQQLLI